MHAVAHAGAPNKTNESRGVIPATIKITGKLTTVLMNAIGKNIGSIMLPSPARWKMRGKLTPNPRATMPINNDCKRVETFLRTIVFVFIAFSKIIFRL